MLGLGCSQCKLGGSTLSRSDRVAFNIPAAPAAPLRWPKFDFTEPSATDPAGRSNVLSTSTMLCASTASPTLVEVPWPSIIVAVAGDTPAISQARSIQSFWPIGLGAV